MITKEIDEIEKASFNINNMVIKFKFAELPNDMKMLAYLAGGTQKPKFDNRKRDVWNIAI
jgi:hypothetical protein